MRNNTIAFQAPRQQASTLDKIMGGLGGWAAGYRGQLPQYVAMQQAQEQALSIERQKAAAEDLRRAKMLYDNGDLVGIRDLANERIGLITQLGGDPSDTALFRDLTDASLMGDERAFKMLGAELNNGLMAAADAGLISLPKQPATARVLSADEASALGFEQGSVVQQKPNGEYNVLQKPVSKEDAMIKAVPELRKEAANLTKNFREQAAAKSRIDAVAFNKDGSIKQTPAASLALVFNFMKILDPTSVVRESEFRTAENARAAISRIEEDGVAIPTFVKQALQSVMGQGRMTKEQIQDFVNQSNAIFEGARQVAVDTLSPITTSATERGIPLNKIYPKSMIGYIEAGPANQSDEDLISKYIGQ